MTRDFSQLQWDEAVEDDCRQVVRLAVAEDLGRGHDWTTESLVPERARGVAVVVVREPGVVAGLRAAETSLREMGADATWSAVVRDGSAVDGGTTVAEISGRVRDLFAAERILLNLMGRLSGVATLTRQYVESVAGTNARVYDTRKTTPGWRRLEKYAVRCGGGWNHRTGLFDAVLIKDNHLAFGAGSDGCGETPAGAVQQVRRFLDRTFGTDPPGSMIVEVEVDTLEQLQDVLPAGPDIILLDNMSPDQLHQAVKIRDAAGMERKVELEASGGVSLDTVRAVAESGVDRISIGALTHSAACLDVGLDWRTGENWGRIAIRQ